GYVLPGLPNIARSQPQRGSASTIVGRIPGGGFFNVLEGPMCGPEGRYWWRVSYQGITGWTAEGENGVYWIAPLYTCNNSPPPRLTPNTLAQVLPGLPNRLRDYPGTNGAQIGEIPGGGVFTVLDGPQCGPEGWTWWRVNYNGQVGWTAEGQGSEYWLAPYSYVPEPPPPAVCTLTPRLSIGAQGRVTPGDPNTVRSQPYAGGGSTILGYIPGGGVFNVLEGPSCGPDGRYWWRVTYQGVTGWTPEGENSTYWLEPYYAPTPPIVCSPAPRLVVGQFGYVLPGLPNAVRSLPGGAPGSTVIGEIPGNGVFRILAGPECGSDGRYWWQVNYGGLIGWTAEGEGATYWLAPTG
ncbi:MAG: SH3 domain-containing protein, partial [Chloroflexi bacterium]|nr:SH3 domain-containing protein [Chloroflexota bacterium]